MPGLGTGKRFKPTKYIPVSTAAALLVGASTLFFVFTCPWLTRAISPAVPIYNGIVFLFVLANFSMATFMDPGVFPRAADEDEDKEDDFRAPLYKNVEIKGIQVRMKWCGTCHFYRPPRCSHCSVCDNCVESLDPHCPALTPTVVPRDWQELILNLLFNPAASVAALGASLTSALSCEALPGAAACGPRQESSGETDLSPELPVPSNGRGLDSVTRGQRSLGQQGVTGKFRGGVNPFTRGCYGNVEHVLCSPLAPSRERGEVGRKKGKDGKGANGRKKRREGSGKKLGGQTVPSPEAPPLMVPASWQADFLVPSFSGGLSPKLTSPPTPAMYKYRPGFTNSSKIHYHATADQITLQDGSLGEDDGGTLDYQSEPNLDLPDYHRSALHKTYQSSPLHMDSYAANSRSLSLKSASRQGMDQVALHSLKPEGAPPTPYKAIFSPNSLSNRNSSLSYDSLLNPMSPAGRKCPAHSVVSSAGYHSPYLSAKMCHLRGGELQRPGPRSFSPVLGGGGPGSHPRDPSPVRYDNLSKTIMASIQERKEMEEREKLLHSHPDSVFGDSGVYDTPSSYSLQQVSTLSSDDPRSLALPCGSRENLTSASSGFGARNPMLQSSLSSLSGVMARAPRTSTTSLQADLANNNIQSHQTLQGRGSAGPYMSPAHQVPSSPSGMPRSPSYGGPKAVSFINTVEITEPPPLGVQREHMLLKTPQSILNGQSKGLPRLGPVASTQGVPGSPSRHTSVKKVSGVGGTTYEISV
uniref:Palmitoyltransferase n=1 Tax=Monodelphis domestica TaxID=13616 RepID=F7GLB3_MONDO